MNGPERRETRSPSFSGYKLVVAMIVGYLLGVWTFVAPHLF